MHAWPCLVRSTDMRAHSLMSFGFTIAVRSDNGSLMTDCTDPDSDVLRVAIQIDCLTNGVQARRHQVRKRKATAD